MLENGVLGSEWLKEIFTKTGTEDHMRRGGPMEGEDPVWRDQQ